MAQDFQYYLDLVRQFNLGLGPSPRLSYQPTAARASTTGSAQTAPLPVGTRLPDGGVVVESAQNPFGSYTVVDYGQTKRVVGSNVARTAAQARPGSPLWNIFYDEQGNPVRGVLERVKRARKIGVLRFTPGQKRALNRLRGRT